jgi:phenylalanyl-tRNA synthetase beta chain
MTISYNWLSEYLPEKLEPAILADILTSIGLEVESTEYQEKRKSTLMGLVVGEVLSCEKHPDADKLNLTSISTGTGSLLQIVCGAANVAVGQKVVVALPGTMLYPNEGEPFKIQKTKIRGVESEGMLCAEDEIGIGSSHAGIIVLPSHTQTGASFADIYLPGNDIIFEIGLTPNRIDAMSHLGVARDICAYLSHHQEKQITPTLPYPKNFATDGNKATPSVEIIDKEGCKRYSGVLIEGIIIKESPDWLQQKLKSINVRPINNIVDITNFILHETGQPLHAFDYDQIRGGKIIVNSLTEGTAFVTLDNKERKLHATDLMICDEQGAMCMAGVYGGVNSSVTDKTKTIFLESAWFKPSRIRKTSLDHGLRTDAAARFEKGCDISNTIEVLKRAALLIKETSGGLISGNLIDIYPAPAERSKIDLTYNYLKKLSGKEYQTKTVKSILENLGFKVTHEDEKGISVFAPFSKIDIHHPCDVVEEIMRIDGLDNIEIPSLISLSPTVSRSGNAFAAKEKIAALLVATGFNEILSNSITNGEFYPKGQSITMINSLSAGLNAMRPSMLESGLQAIAFNLHRKNTDLKFFEFGNTYHITHSGGFEEKAHIGIYVTGNIVQQSWNEKEMPAEFFYLKGVIANIFLSLGITEPEYESVIDIRFSGAAKLLIEGTEVGILGSPKTDLLRKMDIKQQTIWYAEISWDSLLAQIGTPITNKEISRFPAMERDLALVLDKAINYSQVRETVQKLNIPHLKSIHLFDLFESEKLGRGKKSLAVRFVFQNNSKTLTDKEVDDMMLKLMAAFENTIQAEIRK